MTVNFEVAEGVGTIRLDRPPMNALDVAVQDRLREIAEEATERDDVRAVVIWGGEKVFAAGADIKEMRDMDHAAMVKRSKLLQDSFTAVARIPKPVVAAVTGYALGGGCELALCADIRIAADNAKLGQPEILLGLIPGAGGTQRLARLVGPAKAKDLIFTGRQVRADEALAIGLVDRVVPAAEVYEQAHDWAAKLAKGPAIALRAAKESVDAGLETDIDTGLAVERNWFAGLFATEDTSAVRSRPALGTEEGQRVGSNLRSPPGPSTDTPGIPGLH
ncbi:enoyl-CoA hydratase-related protein, partial [Streptomyces sp. NPDC048845]|uniref:enoyl-CoA hydratase/isomerase family protein n=1 Tax=Streptomyces sp. NPDC048845 TaxID=3155390 RepID=UPI00343251A0